MKHKHTVLLFVLIGTLLAVTACHSGPVKQSTIDALGYGDWDTRWGVARGIAQLRSEAVPDMVTALAEEDPRVREGAAWTLGLIGAEEGVVPALVEALQHDENRQVRAAAAWALGEIGGEQGVIQALSWALEDRDWLVSKAAGDALVRIRPSEEVVPVLSDALTSESSQVRLVVVEALGQMGKTPGAVSALSRALQDEEASVRLTTSEVLLNLGTEAVDAIPALVQSLQDESARVRQNAAETLEKIGPEAIDAVPALSRALEDEDVVVRETAARALAEIGPAAVDAVPALITALEDEASRVRWAASKALAGIGKEAVAAVVLALQHEDASVRKGAVSTLELMGPMRNISTSDEVIGALTQAMRDDDALIRRAATMALGEIGPQAAAAVPTLLLRVDDENPDVRWAAVWALGQIREGDEEVVKALIVALSDESPAVRENAAKALGRLGPEASMATEALARALMDDKVDVRETAAEAMGMIENADAIPALSIALQDEDAGVRAMAAQALGRFGPRAKDAVPGLRSSMLDEAAEVREAAVSAMGQIGPDPDVILALSLALEDKGFKVRKAAANAMISVGPEAAISPLLQALQHESVDVRKIAVWALGEMGPAAVEAAPALIEALTDENFRVRQSAVSALGNLGASAVPYLMDALQHPTADVRESAAKALAHIGPPAKDVTVPLSQALQDESAGVRWAAAWALGAIGPEAAVAVTSLVDATQDVDADVRRASAWALGVIGANPEASIPALILLLPDTGVGVNKAAHDALVTFAGQDLGITSSAWLDWWETTSPSDLVAVPTPASESAESPRPDLIRSSLFDLAWDDRAVFRSGLTEAAQPALDRLPGATVYHIDVHISGDNLLVMGREEVRYTNRESDTLDEIYFRLFPNASGGFASVTEVTVDDENIPITYEADRSAVRVPLLAPLPPGEQIVINLAFNVTLSTEQVGRNYGLLGYFNKVLTLDTFYPVIPVYENGHWDVDVLPSRGDLTYLDASFYLVNVTTSANARIISSGIEVTQERDGDRQVVMLAAGPARNFYLSASERFVGFDTQVGETTVTSYVFAQSDETATRALSYAVAALESFNERFGAYPYTELDVVCIPMKAQGIEYPGLIGIAPDLYDPSYTLSGTPSRVMLEAAVAHEVAHQWFYNGVGNDQVREPWLDEALAQYLTGLYYEDTYGETSATQYRKSWTANWDRADHADMPIGLPTVAYGDKYQGIIYGRAPWFLMALASEMGEQAFDKFLYDYYQSYEWEISTTAVFEQLAEQHCACDLTPLFEDWVYGGF